jgi:hypothetical protein
MKGSGGSFLYPDRLSCGDDATQRRFRPIPDLAEPALFDMGQSITTRRRQAEKRAAQWSGAVFHRPRG